MKELISGSRVLGSVGTQVRDVTLLPGETITCVFSPELGLTQAPPLTGQVLIATNQRVLAFCRNDGRDETFLTPVEDLKGVAVKSGSRNTISIFQGVGLAVGGILLYLVVAYWMTGQFEGPNVPFINVDVGPLLVLLAALVAGGLMGRHYFSRDDGSVMFQGTNWSFEFPYRGDRASQEIYQVVNSLFAARLSVNGHSYLWED
jgi:hypothetical protein